MILYIPILGFSLNDKKLTNTLIQYGTLPPLGDISEDRATFFHIGIHSDFKSTKMLPDQVTILGIVKICPRRIDNELDVEFLICI